MPQRPAVMVGLRPPDIVCELYLLVAIDLVQEMLQQDIFGGNGRIRLQNENPVAIVLLPVEQGADAARDRLFNLGGRYCRDRVII